MIERDPCFYWIMNLKLGENLIASNLYLRGHFLPPNFSHLSCGLLLKIFVKENVGKIKMEQPNIK
jgi:hypothetical protein